ncbi:MAG: hypothetical protein Q9227_001847 [Pyrenula ochraceoflavens]
MGTKTEGLPSAIRSDFLRRSSAAPASPHTPQRPGLSSTYSSPGASYGQEGNTYIFELGSRCIRAGIDGDASSHCVLTFGPEQSRRNGDYRGYRASGIEKPGNADKIAEWGNDHELWDMDLKNFDLGLLKDKLERAVREAYTKYLLTDAGNHRVALVVPSIIPHPLLSTVLTLFFDRFKAPTIMLLPSPTMAAVSAGVRSALVVDVGWRETVVTAVYEYREILNKRSTRGMKSLVRAMGQEFLPENVATTSSTKRPLPFDFTFAEDLTHRLAWCKQVDSTKKAYDISATKGVAQLSLNDQHPEGAQSAGNEEIEIDWPLSSPLTDLKVPLVRFAEPTERTFFQSDSSLEPLDDQELLLPQLLFKPLLALPPDVRATLMSRIVFVGGGSRIPGLACRAIDEIAALVDQYGWDAVRGERADRQRKQAKDKIANGSKVSEKHTPDADGQVDDRSRRALEALNPVDAKQKPVSPSAPVQGIFRQLESMGSWAGASLLASLKIKGLVEIDRERFLQQGLHGAQREGEISVIPQRMSMGPGVPRAGDRSSWTLAGWA